MQLRAWRYVLLLEQGAKEWQSSCGSGSVREGVAAQVAVQMRAWRQARLYEQSTEQCGKAVVAAAEGFSAQVLVQVLVLLGQHQQCWEDAEGLGSPTAAAVAGRSSMVDGSSAQHDNVAESVTCHCCCCCCLPGLKRIANWNLDFMSNSDEGKAYMDLVSVWKLKQQQQQQQQHLQQYHRQLSARTAATAAKGECGR
jgi:hypothetical protein